MTRDIIDIQDFTMLLEAATSESETFDSCFFEEPVIGIACYGEGNVELTVKFNGKEHSYAHTKGLALSFYADDKVEFQHRVSPDQPLHCVVIVTSLSNLQSLPAYEGELFSELLNDLVQPKDHYVGGPTFYMPQEMQQTVVQVFHSSLEGKPKIMFLRSQAIGLLSQFFGQISQDTESRISEHERLKLIEARNLLISNMDAPPSLSELSKRIGINSYNLKKNFKELFGLPVFKYLQQERLQKAYQLLKSSDTTIQEAAWQVGYDSLSSFSNAFTQKYGYRPSELKKG